ncbi:venom acid phosphatase Acph-1-like [Photinus pyralis]|uniref:venom acid phosphatase Acph-1-like n=2 Tax=Photinus pyralis TaxID=7054 RepID=UPI0012675195|nr:venom acid phosphatase Acph-1-like [Photinus pyralis]
MFFSKGGEMGLTLRYAVYILKYLAMECMISYCANEKTVQMAFAVFRHGDRTTDAGTLYPNDPYINETYEPYGLGELTNRGKRREYRLGQLLRLRYALLLGKQYKKGTVRAVSTDSSRTQESLELVLASLYPPRSTELEWNRWLNWNPIAFEIAPHATNRLLSIALMYCPSYRQLFDAYSKSEEGQQIESMFNSQYEYISNHSGLNVTKLFNLFRLYFGLLSESEWGLKLPEWTN